MPGRGSPRLMCRVSEDELRHFDREVKSRSTNRQALMRETLGALLGPPEGREAPNGSEPLAGGVEPVQRADNGSEGHAPAVVPAPSGRPLPDARWITRRSGGELSFAKAQAALEAGEFEWLEGNSFRVKGRVF